MNTEVNITKHIEQIDSEIETVYQVCENEKKTHNFTKLIDYCYQEADVIKEEAKQTKTILESYYSSGQKRNPFNSLVTFILRQVAPIAMQTTAKLVVKKVAVHAAYSAPIIINSVQISKLRG